ncbi:hypothetical protein N42HA_00528 [Lactococcus lactis]|nr:hypothetical protein [Lactococcus lactis]
MFKVKYGDDYLTDYVRFIKVNRGSASESELLLEENSGDGTKVLKSRRKAKEIPMTFHVIDGLDVNVVREKLGSIISTNVIKQLTFSDTPNIYYEATLTGAIEYTDDGFFADGGFTLLVPKGYAESVDTKTLNNDNSGQENGTIINNADNSISVLINNNGTLPIFPTIKITPTAESGFFGIAGQNVLEIGNPDEADEKRKTKQTTIADFKTQSDFDTNFVDATDWTSSWETNISPIPNNSKLKWKTDGIRMSTFSQAATWNAGIQRYDVPKDSTHQYPVNWHAQFNTFFIQSNARQAGRFQLYFCDEKKQPWPCLKFSKVEQVKMPSLSSGSLVAIIRCINSEGINHLMPRQEKHQVALLRFLMPLMVARRLLSKAIRFLSIGKVWLTLT